MKLIENPGRTSTQPEGDDTESPASADLIEASPRPFTVVVTGPAVVSGEIVLYPVNSKAPPPAELLAPTGRVAAVIEITLTAGSTVQTAHSLMGRMIEKCHSSPGGWAIRSAARPSLAPPLNQMVSCVTAP